MSQPGDTPVNEGTSVTPEEIQAAMGVNAVPDEVRTHSTDPDETGLVVDGGGQLHPPTEDADDAADRSGS